MPRSPAPATRQPAAVPNIAFFTICQPPAHVGGLPAMGVGGDMGREFGMSVETRDYLQQFWGPSDEIIHAALLSVFWMEMLFNRCMPVHLCRSKKHALRCA